ncbi:endoplasmic reticulum lectin 1 [Denticeps clupeoides]|uniref:Endoplasmic reticulum lectin n=1 Tax=Denticeps clupeoides TaxID=299321 RepID=A0AAY4C712_9TELE|nr:endoplasmic reticulum lectin 1 [Denticeps clupeoides]
MHSAELLLAVFFFGLPGLCVGVSANRGGSPVFTDEIPFKITWPGNEFTLPTSALYREDDFLIMTTAEEEKYKCLLPSLAGAEEDERKVYSGPSPADLLNPLFKQSSCSYRIESYWTYEVCHGKHVKQYHEEKETGQKMNVQEYFLGKIRRNDDPSTEYESENGQDTEKSDGDKEVPTKNVEGQLTPYFPVEMGNGTPCTLKQNEPRSSSVLYVCHPEAKHEILSIAEVATCEYEVVVLTPLLCAHPKYRFQSSPVNAIFCQAMAGSPLRPQRLSQLDKEQEELLKPPFGSSSDREEDVSPVREEAYSATHKPMAVGGQAQVTVGTTHISRLTDEQLIKEFLSGSYCLHGGVGWWKYEFCYGRHVHQYHEDREQGKNIVVVGNWNEEEHMEWAKKNIARSYQLKDDVVQKVKVVSHFYGHGDVCDLTGRSRQVIVKLKCKDSESPHAVTVYMLEPNTCQYVLGVESPVICKILDTADENGLLSVPS